MIKSLRIENFRGFSTFEIGDLSRINLLGGGNNIGKTALLEALMLLVSDGNPDWVRLLLGFRGLIRITGSPHEKAAWLWQFLFHEFDTSKEIRIHAITSIGEALTLRVFLRSRASRLAVGSVDTIANQDDVRRNDLHSGVDGMAANELVLRYSNSPIERVMFVESNGDVRNSPADCTPKSPGYFLGARLPNPHEEDARLYGSLKVEKREIDLVSILQLVEPRLVRIDAYPSPSGLILYGDTGLKRMLPLGMLGDGLARLTSIILRIATAPNGYVAIDEVENGFHHAIIENVWAAISEATERFNVQMFATTHSLEAIRAAHDAYQSRSHFDLRYRRLERRKSGLVEAIEYSHDEITAVAEADIEVR